MKISKYGVGLIGALSLISGAMAQSYQAVELAGPSSWAFSGYAAGAAGSVGSATSTFGHATVWDALGIATDVHPAFLDTPTAPGASQVNDVWNYSMAGAGRGAITNNRLAAIMWRFGVPSLVPMPNGGVNYLSQAYATDEQQVVGEYIPWASQRDRVAPGDSHAFVYDIASGSLTDLYNGNPCVALDVKYGYQVGYEIRGQSEARLWTGNAKNFVNLHPAGFTASMANALDGGRQVGWVAQTVNKIGEAKRGIKIRYDFACMWTGTANSLVFLSHAYQNSLATDISGLRICGEGIVTTGLNGTRGAHHALVWEDWQSPAVELHDLLPAGYVSSFANSIDQGGNVYGSALDANGKSHAIKWVRL